MVSSAPNSPGGVARSRQDTGANLLQELEALSQALYKASQAQNLGSVAAPAPVAPRKDAGSHLQRRETLPARPSGDVYAKHLLSPGPVQPNPQGAGRKTRHSISAKPSLPLYEDPDQDVEWKQPRPVRHSIAAPRAFDAEEAPVPRVERKLQPWHSQGFEQNLPEVTNFPAWLEDNINFSKKLEVVPEKKKSIWNWKPFRTLSHIGHSRHNCLFTVHVHAIEGLPAAMNGLRLTVHWRHKDRVAQTMPSRVFQGSAEFEETLQLRCSVYGHKSAHHAIKYMPKAFTLCVVALDVDELNLGEHRLDLSRLLPEAPDSEHEDEDKPLSWTTSFKLSGKAKGGTLVVTFGYEILHKDKHDKSGRFGGSVIGSPSPSMPSPSLRSFNSLPHSAHGTPRPRPSDANQYLSPTMSEPGDYHDYVGMEHLNLDESSPQEAPRPSVSLPPDQRYKLYGRPEFTNKPPKGLYPSETRMKSSSFAGGEFALAPTTPKQIVEPAEPKKGSSADAAARSASYGSSDDEDEQEFIVVDQGVEVGHLPDSITHQHSSSSHSRSVNEASDSQGTTTPERVVTPERASTPEQFADEKHISREHAEASTPTERSILENKFVSPGSSGSGRLRRGNSEVVVTPPVHVPTVVQHFETVLLQQAQPELAERGPLQPAGSRSLLQPVQSAFEIEYQVEKDEEEIEDHRTEAHFEAAAEQLSGIHESTGLSEKERKYPEDEVTVVQEVVAVQQQQQQREQDREEEKVALESFGGEDVERIPATVGSSQEERTGGRRQEAEEERGLGELEGWESARAHSFASATHEEIRESAYEEQQEDEMWRNMNASASDQSYNPQPGYYSRNNPQAPVPPVDDLDDEVDLIAGEFLHMLEGGDRGSGGIPLGLSSDSENDSPRALLLKQFEQEALLEGGIGLRMGVPEIPELSLDGSEDSRQYEAGLHSDEYSHGGWQSEEDLELASIMEAAESELQKATQTMRSKTRAKMLEDAETEALMQEWGLNEQAFQQSPPKPAQGFLDSMSNQLSSRIPLEPPALAQGVGPVLPTKDGGMLRSVNPMLLGQGGNASGRLMMQVSKPVVVPSEMGSTGLDIFRRLASGGLDTMALQAMIAMPLEDITGKSVHQIAYESQASLEGPSHGQNYLTSTGYNTQMSPYEGFDSGRQSRRARAGGMTSAGRRGSGGFSDPSDEFVSLEELAPMAMQKIEALAMDGLKIQADMTDETAPYTLDALPYDIGGSESSGRFHRGGLGSLEGVAAMHLPGARDLGDDAPTAGTDGLMSKVISIDEWMRLDAGMYDENDTKDETLAILAAHGAVHKDLVTRGSRDDRIRYLQGAKASANFGKGGFMGNMLTIAMLVQLRDPLRNNEPVGAPMMALVQAERVIVPPRPKIPRRQPSLLGNSERRWDDEDEAEKEAPPQQQFKITAVHMSGLKPSEESQSKAQDNKKKAWGNQKQQQSGSRWLLANGMGKSTAAAKHPALKSKPQPAKTTVKPGESLWSISARVHGTGSKWKEVAALNPHIRNPDVIFANQKIRTR